MTASVGRALYDALATGMDRLDVQVLLLWALGRERHDRAWLLAHGDDPLAEPASSRFAKAVARRQAGEPVAYITGLKAFHGLELAVDARVLDPRPDTETLVDWALELLVGRREPSIVDLGTGSGAIALAIGRVRADARIIGIDRSEDALVVAAENARRLGIGVHWRHGSWFDGLEQSFDLAVSNPPYIREDDPHLAALRAEPRSALVSGADGLDDLRRLVSQAPARLNPGGWLLVEHGWDQAPSVRDLMRAQGFTQVQSRTDLAGIERCSGGRAPTEG